MKLQQGDYVMNLTAEQFREIELTEGEIYLGVLDFKKGYADHLLFNGKTLIHAHSCFNPVTELPFEEFKQRAINTFKHEKED